MSRDGQDMPNHNDFLFKCSRRHIHDVHPNRSWQGAEVNLLFESTADDDLDIPNAFVTVDL